MRAGPLWHLLRTLRCRTASGNSGLIPTRNAFNANRRSSDAKSHSYARDKIRSINDADRKRTQTKRTLICAVASNETVTSYCRKPTSSTRGYASSAHRTAVLCMRSRLIMRANQPTRGQPPKDSEVPDDVAGSAHPLRPIGRACAYTATARRHGAPAVTRARASSNTHTEPLIGPEAAYWPRGEFPR
jgi:hypothetical protein